MRGTGVWVGGAVVLAALGGVLTGAPGGATRVAAADAVTGPDLATLGRAELMKTDEWLASPVLRGRLAGSPEFLAAARGAAERLHRWGLRPVTGTASDQELSPYFQELAVEYNAIETCDLAFTRPDGSMRELSPGVDFACRGLTGAASLTAPVVFVGYGLSRPDAGYDDYAGVDVQGRVVLAFKEAPPFQADSSGWGGAWMPRPKGATAAARGAVALLLVSRPGQDHPQRPIGSMLEGEAEHDPDFPRLQLSVDAAESLLEGTGLHLVDLQAAIDSTHRPHSRALATSARINVQSDYDAARRSVNVLALLPGSDAALRDQVVVLGAHLDHVGGQGSIYYPGANDNASGASVVLGIAHALAACPSPPRRSILFALWSSEEAGLLGARHFVEQPPIPRERIAAYLNFDCVGHGDSLEIGGGEEYPGLWTEAQRQDAAGARLLVTATRRGGGADADPFEEAGIPNLYFASRFSYTHLHQPTDTPATLSPALLEAVARVGGGVAWAIAQDQVDTKRVEAAAERP